MPIVLWVVGEWKGNREWVDGWLVGVQSTAPSTFCNEIVRRGHDVGLLKYKRLSFRRSFSTILLLHSWKFNSRGRLEQCCLLYEIRRRVLISRQRMTYWIHGKRMEKRKGPFLYMPREEVVIIDDTMRWFNLLCQKSVRVLNKLFL